MSAIRTRLLIGFFFFAMALSLAPQVSAQTTVTIGTQYTWSDVYPWWVPMDSYESYSYSAEIYRASEMGGAAAGAITLLRFDKYPSGEYLNNNLEMEIYIKHTSADGFSYNPNWGTETGSATLVYSTTTGSAPSTGGWEEVYLDTPFPWNGTDNIMILCRVYKPSGFMPTNYMYYWWMDYDYNYPGAYYISNYNPGSPDLWTYGYRARLQFELQPDIPMSITGVTASHPFTTPVTSGSANQVILKTSVTTLGIQNPQTLNSMMFNTNGSTAAASDITNAKVYYTGGSENFSTATQYGSDYNGPSGNFTVNGSLVLKPGKNNFWLVYDISASATVNDVVDAENTEIVINAGTSYFPSPSAPTGSRTIKAPLCGQYTIGGAGADYASFADAVGELNVVGVSCPVEFLVNPGIYTEQIALNSIPSLNATNTVTFRSANSVPTSVTLQYASGSTADNFVVKMNGVDFVAFKDMTIKNTGTYYSRVLDFAGNTEYVTVENCDLICEPGSAGTMWNDYIGCIYNNSASCNYNTFLNNRLDGGGYYSVNWYGDWSNYEYGNSFIGNSLKKFGYFAMYGYNQVDFVFRSNLVTEPFSSQWNSGYGAYFGQIMNTFDISKNKIIMTNMAYAGTGFYAWGLNASNQGGGRVSNNFVAVGSPAGYPYGMTVDGPTNVDIVYNTVVVPEVSQNGYAYTFTLYYPNSGNKFANNIIDSRDDNGYALYGWGHNAGAYTLFDYNVYNNAYTPSFIYMDGYTYNNLGAWQAGNGNVDVSSHAVAPFYADMLNGDLHLASSSIYDPNMQGVQVTGFPDDIENENRDVPYIGADEPCYVPKSMVGIAVVDNNGAEPGISYFNGTANIKYWLRFSPDPTPVTITLKFYNPFTNTLMYTYAFSLYKSSATQDLEGVEVVQLPANMTAGFYRVEGTFYTMGTCRGMVDVPVLSRSLLVAETGSTPCIVWPGDCDHDGRTTYADRKAFSKYLVDANLQYSWLNGPKRYRAEATNNPMAMLEWVGQLALPWVTPDGCHMDTDGNGVINTFDMIGIKANWMRTHGTPKDGAEAVAFTFDMTQNYPNPFNPSTTIDYTVPERSTVKLTVTDGSGKVVATLVDGAVASGTHSVDFNASQLASGTYVASVQMIGLESGMTFSKTLKMTLAK